MNKERIEGNIDQAKGKAKETIGKATGNAQLQGEGKADQLVGKTKSAVGAAKDTVKDAADTVKNSVD
jgi:uncharacterized protein YjbJ (UPF0337 family)